jgi:hypothetical protein
MFLVGGRLALLELELAAAFRAAIASYAPLPRPGRPWSCAMPEPRQPYQHPRRYVPLIISLVITLVLLLAACPLGVLAIQQRVIAPPTFAVWVGDVEFAAPCPTRGFDCDDAMPWYAIWRGDPEPDGSITYRQLFFVYLKPAKRR